VKDVINSMKNDDKDVKDGEYEEDEEESYMMKKLIGEKVMMKGMEKMVKE
jgi:hypothetical protein